MTTMNGKGASRYGTISYYEGGRKMADTRTEINRRYNEKTYKRIYVQFPIDMVDKFKDKCERLGVSQASVIREAIEKFLEE